MKVFLSWSGDASHKIAMELHSWLPMVIQKIEPYISSDIDKGTRWGTDIARELEQCSFGIACVTKENVSAPWLLFEAGALSKSVSDGRLAPLLCGLNQTDVPKSPLTQFQMTKFEKSELFKLLKSINDCLEAGSLDEGVLSGIFNALWPQLETAVAGILDEEKRKVPAVSSKQGVVSQDFGPAIEEILTASRTMSQVIASPERILPPDYIDYVFRRGNRFEYSGGLRRVHMMIGDALALLGAQNKTDEDCDRAYEILKSARFMIRDSFGMRSSVRVSRRDRAMVDQLEIGDAINDHGKVQLGDPQDD